MRQRTTTVAPSGRSVNSVVLFDLNGLRNSRAIVTDWSGSTAVIVMRPAPALRLPAHS